MPAWRSPRRRRQYRYTRLRWRVLFALVDAVGWALFAWAKWFSGGRHAPAARSADCDVQRVLVVQLDHLGDAILSLGFLAGLRHAYPQAQIDVLAAPWNAEVFRATGHVDQIHVWGENRFARPRPRGWWRGLLAWGWRLRKARYDLAIDVRGEFPHALLLWLTGARRRVGWDCGGGGFLLTDSPVYHPQRHEVLSRQALLDVLGIRPPEGRRAWEPHWPIAVDPANSSSHMDVPHRAIVIHVGSGMPAKRWPAEHWRAVATALTTETERPIVLVGGAADRPAAAAIAQGFPPERVSSQAGQLSLADLAQLLSRAALFVGADSGPAHLAAAVGTPVIALFSGTNHAAQWKPWGDNVTVLRHAVACSPCHREACPLADHPCLTGLHPRVVVQTALRILADVSGEHNLWPQSWVRPASACPTAPSRTEVLR